MSDKGLNEALERLEKSLLGLTTCIRELSAYNIALYIILTKLKSGDVR